MRKINVKNEIIKRIIARSIPSGLEYYDVKIKNKDIKLKVIKTKTITHDIEDIQPLVIVEKKATNCSDITQSAEVEYNKEISSS